jgi:hypothetical protein
VRREWSTEELIGSWTLVGEDWRLVGNKSGATRLGFALVLKFFEIEARFPRAADELPPAATPAGNWPCSAIYGVSATTEDTPGNPTRNQPRSARSPRGS